MHRPLDTLIATTQKLMLSYLWMRADVKGARDFKEPSWLPQGIQACCFACKTRALTMQKTEKRRQWHFLKGFLSKVLCKLHTTDPWIHRFNAWCFSEITQTFVTWNKLELGWGTHMNFRAGGWCAWMGVTQPRLLAVILFFPTLVTYTKTRVFCLTSVAQSCPHLTWRSYTL